MPVWGWIPWVGSSKKARCSKEARVDLDEEPMECEEVHYVGDLNQSNSQSFHYPSQHNMSKSNLIENESETRASLSQATARRSAIMTRGGRVPGDSIQMRPRSNFKRRSKSSGSQMRRNRVHKRYSRLMGSRARIGRNESYRRSRRSLSRSISRARARRDPCCTAPKPIKKLKNCVKKRKPKCPPVKKCCVKKPKPKVCAPKRKPKQKAKDTEVIYTSKKYKALGEVRPEKQYSSNKLNPLDKEGSRVFAQDKPYSPGKTYGSMADDDGQQYGAGKMGDDEDVFGSGKSKSYSPGKKYSSMGEGDDEQYGSGKSRTYSGSKRGNGSDYYGCSKSYGPASNYSTTCTSPQSYQMSPPYMTNPSQQCQPQQCQPQQCQHQQCQPQQCQPQQCQPQLCGQPQVNCCPSGAVQPCQPQSCGQPQVNCCHSGIASGAQACPSNQVISGSSPTTHSNQSSPMQQSYYTCPYQTSTSGQSYQASQYQTSQSYTCPYSQDQSQSGQQTQNAPGVSSQQSLGAAPSQTQAPSQIQVPSQVQAPSQIQAPSPIQAPAENEKQQTANSTQVTQPYNSEKTQYTYSSQGPLTSQDYTTQYTYDYDSSSYRPASMRPKSRASVAPPKPPAGTRDADFPCDDPCAKSTGVRNIITDIVRLYLGRGCEKTEEAPPVKKEEEEKTKVPVLKIRCQMACDKDKGRDKTLSLSTNSIQYKCQKHRPGKRKSSAIRKNTKSCDQSESYSDLDG